MSFELTIGLDPVSQSGLTVTAQLYAGGSVVKTVPLVETPGGSAWYSNSAIIVGLAAGIYSVRFMANGSAVGIRHNPFRWDGNAELLTVSLPIVPPAGYGAGKLATVELVQINGGDVQVDQL